MDQIIHQEWPAMLRDILILQKREIEARLREPYVERDLEAHGGSHDLVRVVLGPRRAGKSFYAMHLVSGLGRFAYVNFDDERLTGLSDHDDLVAQLDALYEHPEHLLLDEIQNVPRWELLVNRLQRQGYRLIVTGSNAHLLGSELATHLTGRHLPIVLLPFSFREYTRALGGERTESEMAQTFRDYAESGGFPEPLLKEIPRREYLTTLLRSVLYKDVVVRHRIRAPQGLEDLASYLTANVAQRYSLNALTKLTRLRSVHTIQKYLRHLEEAFLVFSVRRFSFKVREQVRANRKAYSIDNGLVTSTSFRFRQDLGRLYENVVAVHLHRRQLEGALECFYWQGDRQEEVDFVIKVGHRVERLIQVCVDPADPRTRAREVRALLAASAALGCDDLLVLTDSTQDEEKASWHGATRTVRFLPAWKWLLAA